MSSQEGNPERQFEAFNDRAQKRRFLDQAWLRFIQEGTDTDLIRREILRSWHRSREFFHLDPATEVPLRVEAPESLAQRCDRDEVLRLAGPILRDIADRFDLCDHALAYFDGAGWLLRLEGDQKVIERLAGIHFQPGTNWSEDSAGTNGPGTALAERKPIEVFASEHFIATWQSWSCAAAPVLLGPNAPPVGLVDLTGPWEVRRRQALWVVRAIARAIAERVGAAQSVREELMHYAFLAAHRTNEALIAIDAGGRVIAMNDVALRRRIINVQALPDGTRDLLARTILERHHPGEFEVVAPDLPAVLASVVRHDGVPIGAILRAPEPPGRRCLHAAAGLEARHDFSEIFGTSGPLQETVRLARIAAQHDLPVILEGETGTGKELFAHAIHAASARRDRPFVAVNCGSIPAHLVEAELFGYEPGAFTDAKREGNIGRCAAADGGTLFLDEVAELPAGAQVALLRVLQEKEVVRLGGTKPRRVDIRVLAATNKPLELEIAAGRFRQDLFYRLNVLSIVLPPLRERRGDVLLLADLFLADAAAEFGRGRLWLTQEAVTALESHPWPGNVRELRNVILRAAATATDSAVTVSDLKLPPFGSGTPRPAAPQTLRRAASMPESQVVLDTIVACNWNLRCAARRLGVSRMTLYRWMNRSGIRREP